MKTLLLLLVMTTFVVNSFAYQASSLDWQRINLEERIQRKLNQSLSPVLQDNQYMVSVEVAVSDPGGPNFGGDKKTGPKVSDISLEDSRGDYLAFSKVGLEVPVLEKWMDEDKTKLMNLYRFNEAYDIFKNLDKVDITVYLDEKLPQDLNAIAQKVVKATKFNTGGVKPNLKFEKLTLEWIDPALTAANDVNKSPVDENGEPIEDPISTKEWLEWFSRFGNAIGLILMSVLLGTFAFLLFKQWKAFMEAHQASAEASGSSQDNKDDEDDKSKEQPGAIAAGGGDGVDDMSIKEKIEETFARFRTYFETSPKEASTLVRKWINEKSKESKLALKGLAQQLSDSELIKVFNELTEAQRSSWKMLLDGHLSEEDLLKANYFLADEAVRAMLVPAKVNDTELINNLMELTPAKAVTFLENYPDYSGFLMYVISPSFTANLLEKVNEQTATQWLQDGTTFDDSQVDAQIQGFKKALIEFKKQTAENPYNDKILEMLPSFNPAKEKILYNVLAKEGNPERIIEAAKQCYPSDMILQMPKDLLKLIMQTYPMQKKVDVLATCAEDERDLLLDSFAPAGSTVREMLMMELENAQNNEDSSTRVVTMKDEIWKEFVYFSRKTLANNKKFQHDCESIIEEWANRLCNAHGRASLDNAA